jgi:hypothetical protein
LFAGSTGRESSRRVNEVDIVKEIVNYLLPFVLGFVEINIQVFQDKGDAALWTGFPSSPKIFHPHRVCGRDVYPHTIESLVASNKLECEEVWHSNSCRLHLISRMILFPQQGNPSLIVARRL